MWVSRLTLWTWVRLPLQTCLVLGTEWLLFTKIVEICSFPWWRACILVVVLLILKVLLQLRFSGPLEEGGIWWSLPGEVLASKTSRRCGVGLGVKLNRLFVVCRVRLLWP